MTFRKRGLGRGLEALLADDSAKEEKQQPQARRSGDYQSVGQNEKKAMPAVIGDGMASTAPPSMEARSGAQADEVGDRTAIVVALFKNIQRENLILLEEAEALRKLIEEFESIVRADLS